MRSQGNAGILILSGLAFFTLPSPSSAAEITVTVRESEDAYACNGAPKSELSGKAFLALASAADIRPYVQCMPAVRFSGEISRSDMQILREVISTVRERGGREDILLQLNSNGGDVASALSFADFVRKGEYHFLHAMVLEKDQCISSCVFVLAGAFDRMVAGKIGIHRPYLSADTVREMGYDDLQKTYDALLPKVRAFFRGTNIRESLADDMWQVPSHRVRVLSRDELADYGLSQDDVVLTEQRNAGLRQFCGPDAPAYEEDWNKILGKCVDSKGVLSPTCMEERLSQHPFCPCYKKSNPDDSPVCRTRDGAIIYSTTPQAKPQRRDARPEKTFNGDIRKATVTLSTSQGPIRLRFLADVAPRHVTRFLDLAYSGFYDGTAFHRVIPGFMIQGGDPRSKDARARSAWGVGDLTDERGVPLTLSPEFSNTTHRRGVLSMARKHSTPDSASAQFFIVVNDSPFLDGQYTVFGEVESGMDVVDRIVEASDSDTSDPNSGGRPRRIQRILRAAVSEGPKE